jgi:hypothetical protein
VSVDESQHLSRSVHQDSKGTKPVAERSSKKSGEKTRRRNSPGTNNSRRGGTVPKASPAYSQTFVMRLNPEFKEWLMRFANYCRLNMVDVIDLALADYAKAKGFEDPPRRTSNGLGVAGESGT